MSSAKATALRWVIFSGIILALSWFVPLFHIVPLKRAVAEKKAGRFDAAHFAQTFWSGILLKSVDRAVDADVLLPAIRRDPGVARTNYARVFGLSDSYFYFLRGKGRVISVADDGIGLAISPGATNAQVVLETGPVFGNAVRDGTGLLDPNQYPNSQDFNDISSALNHLVETRVLPTLRQRAKAGATIRFAGCAEVDDESTDLHPLQVVPIRAQIQ